MTVKFKKILTSRYAFLLIGIILGSFGYAGVSRYYLNEDRQSNAYETRAGGTGLTNPLLDCEYSGGLSKALIPFQEAISALIDQKIQKGDLSFGAVYFRDLNNGPWFGINEKEKFIPASLMKVPVMIAAFKKAESDQEFLNKTVVYQGPLNNTPYPYFKPKEEIVPGNSYTIEDLIRRMIIYSDNNARDLVVMNMGGGKELDDVFKLIGSDFTTNNFLVIVRDYSSFFRVLFNSSYLSREMSEKALQLLVDTKFDPGLVKGLPPGVKIADKVGEKMASGDSEKQLHNCGIIYYPKRPYILCVMTRGDNFDKLADSIADISRAVYQEVDKQFGK